MIIINNRKYRDIFFNEEIFSELLFLNVGHETCLPKHSYGPKIREHYVIHYIIKGKGIFKINGKTYHLKEKNFFLIRPNELSYYEADAEEPWEYYWLGFNGSRVEEILLSRFIDQFTDTGMFHSKGNNLNFKFEDLLNSNPFDYSKMLFRYSIFFDLIRMVNGGIPSTKYYEGISMKKMYSKTFMLYIQNSYHLKELTISSIANSMNLNPSYLSQIIKEELGITPIGYLKEYRLQKASVLLELGNITVTEVADLVGYESVPSFSRAFKKLFGQAPSVYKGQH
ncbi:AraC family transcriptional regulator [Vagococcus bubulae]|uniref:HTH araC/xylS-type domain-containing protein n=1 Tax=Vagococcus bubulae TaxID=1977868 RepID=A0A429ZEN9_9ENTE|nr:AraC family ligand binding domain-containing protein [Vagococcus bubulae]RST92124.1 hypothetical protein CBF36_09175 [Vagococcus bubulae]